jgi:hypothetical protein
MQLQSQTLSIINKHVAMISEVSHEPHVNLKVDAENRYGTPSSED